MGNSKIILLYFVTSLNSSEWAQNAPISPVPPIFQKKPALRSYVAHIAQFLNCQVLERFLIPNFTQIAKFLN
jgi:hypothetical protein